MEISKPLNLYKYLYKFDVSIECDTFVTHQDIYAVGDNEHDARNRALSYVVSLSNYTDGLPKHTLIRLEDKSEIIPDISEIIV